MPQKVLGKKINERHWREAKKQAAAEGKGDNYAYIMSIYKTMEHLNKARRSMFYVVAQRGL